MKVYVVKYTVTNDWEEVEANNATEAHEIGMNIFDADWNEIDVREWKPCYIQH